MTTPAPRSDGGPRRRRGIDGRLLLLIPLSTLFAVAMTAVILSLPPLSAASSGLIPAFVLLLGMGLWLAVKAGPVTRPLSPAVGVAVFAVLRPHRTATYPAPMTAVGLASVAGAAGLAASGGPWAEPGLLALILPGVVLGVVFAAQIIHRQDEVAE